MSGEETIRVYDARAEEYTQANSKLFELAELESFAATLPPGGLVLDLGCGPGQYAAWMARMGFEVHALDASAEMVARAGAHEGVIAFQARFDALEGLAYYDGIWANFSLLHLPRAELPAQLARIRRALKPGGTFHIGMKLGEGEGPDKIGRFYAYYGEDELARLLVAAGFAVTARRRGSGPGLDGSHSDFVTMRAHA
jgi:SAM-dependent methyltransferase